MEDGCGSPVGKLGMHQPFQSLLLTPGGKHTRLFCFILYSPMLRIKGPILTSFARVTTQKACAKFTFAVTKNNEH